MLVEIPTTDGEYEVINTQMLTKIFVHRGATRINLSDGCYVITDIDMDKLVRVISSRMTVERIF